MKRLGPELKFPKLKGSNLKAPPFLADLYYDLRDRRLLPLVVLILVAIVAVPFLLGGSSEDSTPAGPAGPAIAGASSEAAANLTVVQAEPGLRNYRKRLARRQPTDPFDQRYNGPMLRGARLNPETVTTTTSTTTAPDAGSSPETVVTPPAPSSPGGTGGGGSSGGAGGEPTPSPDNPNLQWYVWEMKVQISRSETAADGTVKMGEPEVREGVRSLTPLPAKKQPVVTFMGVNPSNGKALLMVSREVSGTFGDARCVSGVGSCELLELEKGFPETFEYGPNSVRFKFKVISTELVGIKHPGSGSPQP